MIRQSGDFLQVMMLGLGFPKYFTDLVMVCVRSPSFT